MSDGLQGRVAVVTGAGQGIGEAIARALSEKGATVAAIDVNDETARRTADRLSGQGSAHTCDVSDGPAVERTFADIVARWGSIDVLVNNAGIGQAAGDGFDVYQERLGQRIAEMQRGETPTTFADHTIHMGDEGWRKVLSVTLDGTFRCCREALRVMSRDGTAGTIVNVSSTSAYSGEGGAHYCAAKAGVLGLTRSLAEEVGPRGIRVNAVVPGPTLTPVMDGIPEEWRRSMANSSPLGRMAEPEEVAGAVAYLASDEASFVTGHALCANGGTYMC